MPHAVVCQQTVRTTSMHGARPVSQRMHERFRLSNVWIADSMVTASDSKPRVAPVKPEYLRQSAPRAVVEAVTSTGDGAQLVGASKSRRQQQKVRAQRHDAL